MTVVDHRTGEIIEFDRAAAERRAERITLRLDAIAENYRMVLPMIREAIEKRDDIALGYRSPGDYVSDRFGQSLAGLGVEVRRAVVGELTEAGLSTRAIAPVVGISNKTVHEDQRRVTPVTPQTPQGEAARESGPQAPEAAKPVERPRGEPSSAAPRPAAPRPVTGIDGKTYARPEPKPRPVAAPADDEFTEQDRAEELAGNLARNLSLLYAVTNPERRAEYIAAWVPGTRSRPTLGQNFVTPRHMRALAEALQTFATEWEHAHA